MVYATMFFFVNSIADIIMLYFPKNVLTLCCYLQYVHSAGIVHGNLKPSNIEVNEDCELRVSLFINVLEKLGILSMCYYRSPHK